MNKDRRKELSKIGLNAHLSYPLHWCRSPGRHGGRARLLSPGYPQGSGSGHDHDGRRHARGGRPCEVNNRRGCDGTPEMWNGDAESGRRDDARSRGHGRNQNAKRQMGGCEPTYWPGISITILGPCQQKLAPQLLTSIFNRSSRPMRLLCISW